MKAALFESFGGPITVRDVADPQCPDNGVTVAVEANGICRSDWHGWVGHDSGIALPHVPGHELAGVVVEVGEDVKEFAKGDRVTVPFCGGCGHCSQCASGNQQVCDNEYQPGFTGWGSFAEYVALPYADVNLVHLPEAVDFVSGASLGCRFMTAFRAVVDVGRVGPGDWVAVHGCGGVGLSATMIATAMGAQVVAVDVKGDALNRARSVGASATVNADATDDVPAAIRDLTGGGAHVSLDAFGHPTTIGNSVRCLRKRGRHVQVGLMADGGEEAAVPIAPVIGQELEILGSHGMQAHRYPQMLDMIKCGTLSPQALVSHTVTLTEGVDVLTNMGDAPPDGVVVIDRFRE